MKNLCSKQALSFFASHILMGRGNILHLNFQESFTQTVRLCKLLLNCKPVKIRWQATKHLHIRTRTIAISSKFST